MISLVTGGAGFLGSHLINALVADGERVIVIDNLSTGKVRNLERAMSTGRATFVHADVAQPAAQLAAIVEKATRRTVDRIFHFASPASPKACAADPWATLAANGIGTMSLLELAVAHRARFMFASTPQSFPETIDSIGWRGGYDQAKRFGEAAVAAAARAYRLDGRIVRFFNCYGPAMDEADGRLIPELVDAIAAGEPFPIFGTGLQTRSMTFVDDAIELARIVMESDQVPLAAVDVGSDDERSVEEVARLMARVAGVDYRARHLPARPYDPERRCPDSTLARGYGWGATTSLEDGLRQTYRWFTKDRLAYA